MNTDRRLQLSDRWFRLLLRLYPIDFREEMGESLVEAYRDRCRDALRRGGTWSLVPIWSQALVDSLRNGPSERAKPAVGWRRSGNWGRDAEMAVRRLVRAPLFSAAMIGTLTVGLGAFAMVYTVVHKVLIAPLPYRNPNDLFFVWRNYTWFKLDRGWVAGTDVADLQKTGGVIEEAAALRRERSTLSGIAGTLPSEIGVIVSSPELFHILGVRPLLGRLFQPSDGGAGRSAVVVLTYPLWNRLGADPKIVGSSLRLDGTLYTVIGVLDRSFEFVSHSSLGPPEGGDAYTTFPFDLAGTSPSVGSYASLVRARAGSNFAAVERAVGAIGQSIDERHFQKKGLKLYPVALRADLVSGVRPALTVLGLSGVLLLLVLMVNLASLLLVRAIQREREFAVIRALGANPGALARATLLESGLLGAIGSAGGVLVAFWGMRSLIGLAPLDLPRRETLALDWQVAAIVIAVGATLGVIAGVAPALWATRSKLSALLSSAAVRGGGGQGRLRRSLVVVQVALSLVLLSSGALVARSFQRLLFTNPGFDPTGVLTLRVPVSLIRYPNDTVARALHDRIERELRTIPGVSNVGSTSALPLSKDASQTDVIFLGAPGNTGNRDHDVPLIDYVMIRPGYFETLRIPVISGRAFNGQVVSGVHEVIVDRTLAEVFFPGTTPIGGRTVFNGDTLTIVGVVDHVRLYDVHRNGRGQLFLRNDDRTYDYSLSYAVRSTLPSESLIPAVRATVRRIDPELALSKVVPMEQLISESLGQQRLSATLLGGFSIGALFLAMMGLFGVVAGAVTRRRHELAVRLAMGADHGRLLRLVLREGATLCLIGLVLGVPGIYLAGQLIGGVLVGVSPFDPETLAEVGFGLAAIAILACYVPARRVTGIEPAQSLREG